MRKMNEMPKTEQPREKAVMYGITALSNVELLAIMLRTGTKDKNVLDCASELLDRSGGLSGLPRLSLGDLCAVSGISKVKAVQLQACFELVQRISAEELAVENITEHPEKLEAWLRIRLGGKMQEELLVIYLNRARQILGMDTVFRGTLDSAAVSPREVFRNALSRHARYLILVHNHPSGSLTPSSQDINFTSRMIEAGNTMGIDVMDHLIVSQNGISSILACHQFCSV